MRNESKTILYIDAANLILSAKSLNLEFSVYWLLEYLKFRYKVDNCVYFTGKFENKKDEYSFLENLGVEIIFKEVYKENEKTKANCDVEISHRITYDIENDLVDKVILISGDGDFYSLLMYVETKGKKVKLLGIHPSKTSRLYRKRMKFGLAYLSQILLEVDLVKRENLVGPLVPTRLFLGNNSIATDKNLSSEDLLQFSQKTKRDAENILKENNILELLGEVGNVRVCGSFLLDLMYDADIDIEVQSENKRESAKTFLNKILELRLFQKVEFGDFEKFKRNGRPKDFIIVLKCEYRGRKWEIEIWFKEKFNLESKQLEEKVKGLSDEKKMEILKMKHDRSLSGKDKFSLSSVDIYKKFIRAYSQTSYSSNF